MFARIWLPGDVFSNCLLCLEKKVYNSIEKLKAECTAVSDNCSD